MRGGVATLATAGAAIGRRLGEHNSKEHPTDRSGRFLANLSLVAAVASEIGETSGSLQNFSQFTPTARRQASLDAAKERADLLANKASGIIAALDRDGGPELVVDTETVD